MMVKKVYIAIRHQIKSRVLVALYILQTYFQTFHICSPICLKFRMCARHLMPFASSELCEDQRRERSYSSLSSVIKSRLRVCSTAVGRAGASTCNTCIFNVGIIRRRGDKAQTSLTQTDLRLSSRSPLLPWTLRVQRRVGVRTAQWELNPLNTELNPICQYHK